MKMKKKYFIYGALVVLLICLIVVFCILYQKAKAYSIEKFFENDRVILKLDDEEIYASQKEIYKLIKCYELIVNKETNKAADSLRDDILVKDLANMFVISNQCVIGKGKITPEELQSDLRKNLKIVQEGGIFTDKDVEATSQIILKTLKENAEIDNKYIKPIIDNLKYVNQEKFIVTMKTVTKNYMIFNEYYSEYSYYMAVQNFSKVEIYDNFYNKHLADIKGKYIIEKIGE
ncbi:MAG: hypothetical protein RR073_04980 [Clostridia bacterium]